MPCICPAAVKEHDATPKMSSCKVAEAVKAQRALFAGPVSVPVAAKVQPLAPPMSSCNVPTPANVALPRPERAAVADAEKAHVLVPRRAPAPFNDPMAAKVQLATPAMGF